MPSTPVRIVSGSNDEYPSDPVRIANWDAFLQALWDELGLAPKDGVALSGLMKNTSVTSPTLGLSYASVGGVEQVSITWSTHDVNVAGVWLTMASGSLLLNAGHIANPTNYYVYIRDIGGSAVMVVSNTNPEDDPLVNYKYAWLSIIRMKEAGNNAIIYYVRRAHITLDTYLHHAGEWDLYTIPTWANGGVISIDAATGEIDMTEVEYRRLRFEGTVGAITNGTILYGDEGGSAANLELIQTYRDGSAIGHGKYIKLLFGVITSPIVEFPLMVVRQSKPAVEYATRAAAVNDAENMAGVSFPSAYRGNVMPLAYITMLEGDASDLETIDLRSSVAGGGGGGGSPIADHSLLANLGADDHAQYLRTDGARTLTGNMAVDAGHTIDGLDLSVHEHTGAGVHGAVVDHGNLGGLAHDDHSQYLLASGARALAGNLAVNGGITVDGVDIGTHNHDAGIGNGAKIAHGNLLSLGSDDHTQYLKADGTRQLTDDLAVTAGKTIDGVDISAHALNATAHQNKVTLGADADVLLGLTDQQIDLDTQTANRVFSGPAAGAPADPTFRALVALDIPSLLSSKISDFDEAAQDAVGNILAATGDITLTYDDATPKITANLNTEGELQVVLAVGNNNNIAISTARLIYITGPAGNFTITGVAGGYAGKRVYLYNTTTNNMTIPNEDVLSLAANRIRTLGPTVATSGVGVVELIYSGLASRWIVVGQHG